MERTIYEVVSDIQARKEREKIVPAFAKFSEIKEAMGKEEGTLYALLDAEVLNGIIVRRKTINGYAYCVSEE